ncbi:restriction endonuclease subunit S [Tepidimicrobium xylanilyticum]|uniref:restriction endonuclease subunit S n=1 Tax=Tepidimicrobium xylanilyticum TaxID=1123352 RepID=UPI00264C5689|nr:restriction endonuclease subunit S [Tepidimicrobium xylanilyticum]GMG97966.1 restriction modification system DNA specificity domain-containing protein [Tepidimicrobium xylanilyticum]
MSKYKRYERYKDSGVEWIGEIPEEWEFRRISHICTLGRGRVISKIEIAENEGEYPVYSSQTENDGVLGYINTYDFEGDYVTWTTDGANAGTVFRRTGRFNCTNVCGTLKPKENNLDLSYLTYALSLETKRYVRLDINPKLMNNEMAKIRVLFPPSDEQKAIANFLDQKTAEIDDLIADKEKLIELLQEKRQAIITEAVTKGLNPNVRMKDSGIEWIGEIPEHWILSKIKYVSLINNKTLSESTDDDYEIDYIDISSVTSIGEIDGIQRLNFKDAPSRARRILSKGDTIVSTVRTYLKAIAFIENVQSNLICSTGFAVLTPLSKVVPKYLFYLMRSEKYVNEIVRRSVGVSYPAINASDIGALECAIPNKDEQKYIVEYLDNCTTQIDQLVNDIQTQIQKLKEYRQSLISETVTGKIDVRDYYVNN